jgi:hypothetical protein
MTKLHTGFEPRMAQKGETEFGKGEAAEGWVEAELFHKKILKKKQTAR